MDNKKAIFHTYEHALSELAKLPKDKQVAAYNDMIINNGYLDIYGEDSDECSDNDYDYDNSGEEEDSSDDQSDTGSVSLEPELEEPVLKKPNLIF